MPNLGRFTVIFYIFGGAAKLRWAGGAQRPVWRANEPKKTGARSARARTRGQNPLVYHKELEEWPGMTSHIQDIPKFWHLSNFEYLLGEW